MVLLSARASLQIRIGMASPLFLALQHLEVVDVHLKLFLLLRKLSLSKHVYPWDIVPCLSRSVLVLRMRWL